MYSSPASIFTVNALLPPGGGPDLFIPAFQDELMDTPGPYRHHPPSVGGGENINETDNRPWNELKISSFGTSVVIDINALAQARPLDMSSESEPNYLNSHSALYNC